MRVLFPLLALAFATAPAISQSGVTDSGAPLTQAPAFSGGFANGTGCGSGVTNAHPFVGGNSFAGNMFDIAPSVDMTIECVDVNWSVAESIDVAVWWCPGTVVGNWRWRFAWPDVPESLAAVSRERAIRSGRAR